MTTIAYKDGIIAFDSLTTSGITIVNDNYNKHHVVDGIHFFLTGTLSDYRDFIASWFDKESDRSLDVGALVYDGVELWKVGHGDKLWRQPLDLGVPVAIGSGEDHAITAMDLGLNAKRAVKMAAKRDTCTGGKIRTFKLNV